MADVSTNGKQTLMTCYHSDDPGGLPKSEWTGTFLLGSIRVCVHVLESGHRVAEGEGMSELMQQYPVIAQEVIRWLDGGPAPSFFADGDPGKT